MNSFNRVTAAIRTVLRAADPRNPAPWCRGAHRTHRPSIAVERLEARSLMCASGATNPAAAGGPTNNPALIEKLAAEAYIWGLGPEFTQRFSTYNTTLTAPYNALEYGSVPAAWNNPATNAGDASILYLNGFTDFSKVPALVLTVPPSSNQYYVVNYLDDYVNTIGSIGTRTTPSNAPTSYLLVGPNSTYAKFRSVNINGYDFPVMASDTNLNWMLIRVAANTLSNASDPQSVPSVYANVVQKFAMNTLAQFEQNGNQPVYPTSSQLNLPSPTPAQLLVAQQFQNTPTSAVRFFNQLGTSVKNNPIPAWTTGLSGTLLKRLPSWVVPQYGARVRYTVPSYGQAGILRLFAPIGLTKNGYQVPRSWGPKQLQALQAGYQAGQAKLDAFISGGTPSSSTNYWTILNTIIGTYPNNQQGYKIRSAIVLNGGSANVPLDAVYPSMNNYMGTAQLDGNNTYSITFTPPASSSGQSLPVSGTFPPLVNNSQGKPQGFWSITLYQPDLSEVAAPFLSQAADLNTHYSTADTSVVSVDAATSTLTVSAPTWGNLTASTPILFGANAAQYGLTPNTLYYVAGSPTTSVDPTTGQTVYSFQISTQWIQTLSPQNVPIQYSGGPGPIVPLQSQAGAGPLTYGMVKPVSQLGSDQLSAGQLTLNPDGTLTLWFSPSLPSGVPASNWIPTPSSAYFSSIYPNQTVNTNLQILLRMYYPTPGNTPPSILPYQKGRTRLPESYIPPTLQLVN